MKEKKIFPFLVRDIQLLEFERKSLNISNTSTFEKFVRTCIHVFTKFLIYYKFCIRRSLDIVNASGLKKKRKSADKVDGNWHCNILQHLNSLCLIIWSIPLGPNIAICSNKSIYGIAMQIIWKPIYK